MFVEDTNMIFFSIMVEKAIKNGSWSYSKYMFSHVELGNNKDDNTVKQSFSYLTTCIQFYVYTVVPNHTIKAREKVTFLNL